MPEPTYELSFALFLLDGHVSTRRAFTIVNAIKGAMAPTLDKRFFDAMFEAEDEAEFEHAVHVDRVDFATRRARARQREFEELGEAAIGE